MLVGTNSSRLLETADYQLGTDTEECSVDVVAKANNNITQSAVFLLLEEKVSQ